MKNKIINLATSDNVYIIAEIGINHEGDLNTCLDMVSAAFRAGADAVKLQSIDPNLSYSPTSESYPIFSKGQLSNEDTGLVFSFARSLGLDVFTTCGDYETAMQIDEYQPSCWKVSSGLLTHIPLIRQLTSFGRPLVLSTGLSNINEIREAVNAIKEISDVEIILLHCVSVYPTPIEILNLKKIGILKNEFQCQVGYSDHSVGIEAPYLAVAAGARVIEKHFSFDVSRDGFDHAISLDESEFKKMVNKIRLAELFLGSGGDEFSKQIIHARQKYLRSIVAIDNITEGSPLDLNNIGVRRTNEANKGSEPKFLDSLLGTIAKKNYKKFDPIRLEDTNDD